MITMRPKLPYLTVIALAVALHAAPKDDQRTFATAEEAAQALLDASEHNDSAALLKILGPDGKDIVASGAPAEDTKNRAAAARAARAKQQIDQDRPRAQTRDTRNQ